MGNNYLQSNQKKNSGPANRADPLRDHFAIVCLIRCAYLPVTVPVVLSAASRASTSQGWDQYVESRS